MSRYCPLPSRKGGPTGPFIMGCVYFTWGSGGYPPPETVPRASSRQAGSSSSIIALVLGANLFSLLQDPTGF